jgi:hypothetical protein
MDSSKKIQDMLQTHMKYSGEMFVIYLNQQYDTDKTFTIKEIERELKYFDEITKQIIKEKLDK